jgi:hypothetical protein
MQVEYSPFFNKNDKNISLQDLEKLKRATDHGYRGASKKRHNGIVPIRPTDTSLFKDLEKYARKESIQAQQSFISSLPVKVVAHVKTGHRLVGYSICPKKDIYILGVSKY